MSEKITIEIDKSIMEGIGFFSLFVAKGDEGRAMLASGAVTSLIATEVMKQHPTKLAEAIVEISKKAKQHADSEAENIRKN